MGEEAYVKDISGIPIRRTPLCFSEELETRFGFPQTLVGTGSACGLIALFPHSFSGCILKGA